MKIASALPAIHNRFCTRDIPPPHDSSNKRITPLSGNERLMRHSILTPTPRSPTIAHDGDQTKTRTTRARRQTLALEAPAPPPGLVASLVAPRPVDPPALAELRPRLAVL